MGHGQATLLTAFSRRHLFLHRLSLFRLVPASALYCTMPVVYVVLSSRCNCLLDFDGATPPRPNHRVHTFNRTSNGLVQGAT